MSGRTATKETANVVWSGSWVAERLGVELVGDGELRELLGLALRRNPKRAHLLVSQVLGKHVPQHPSVVYGAGFELGRRVRELLGEAGARRAVVLGYAETATGLGHAVADGLGTAPYLHSTRRPIEGVARAGGFEESHSHATSHLLLPEDPDLLAGDVGGARDVCGAGDKRDARDVSDAGDVSDVSGAGDVRDPGETHSSDAVLVLVDDEFSTGNTVLNTIRALHERNPRNRYVIVALVDMRSPADRGRLADFAAEIGARVDLVARNSGTVRLPDGVLEKGQALVTAEEVAQEGERQAGAAPRPASGAPAPAPGWTSGGPQVCPTAAGTASPPRTAPGWNRHSPPWPTASPPRWTTGRAAY